MSGLPVHSSNLPGEQSHRTRTKAVAVTLALSMVLMLSVAPLPRASMALSNALCGTTLKTNTVLTDDVGACYSTGLIIGADNIVLNCAGHSIRGAGVGFGVDVNGYNGVKIKKCVVIGFSTGIRLLGSSGDQLVGNSANNNTNIGFLASGSSSLNSFVGDTANFNSYLGFKLTGSSNRLTGDVATYNTAGFFLGGSYNRLFSSKANFNDQWGFVLNKSSTFNKLSANSAKGNGNGGYFVSGPSNTVVGNKALGNSNYGFFIDGTSTQDVIQGNQALSNSYGFTVEGASNKLRLNSAIDNSQYGFWFDGSSITASINTAKGSGGGGFAIWGSNSYLTRNNANLNHYGFYVAGSSNLLTSNSANGNYYGFWTRFSGSGNQLKANVALMSSTYGYLDASTGTGSRGTADVYSINKCSGNLVGGSSPAGLCSPQS